MGLIDNIKIYGEGLNLNSEKNNLFQDFIEKGFPSIKDEEWKYTSLRKLVKNDFKIEDDATDILGKEIDNYSLSFENRILFVNGNLISNPSIKGVTISDFSENNTSNDSAMESLNSSLANKGFTISIEKNIVVKNPIEILFFTNCETDSFQQYRNQITIGGNSEIKIVERIQNISDSSCFVNHYTQIKVAKNSNLEYNKIQNNTNNSALIDTLNIFQESDSNCKVNTLIFGGQFTRNNLNFEQNGSNCDSFMNGISILDYNQFADNHTFVDHKKADCRSNEMYKGIYLGNSKGVFNGKIMVRPDAQKIDAFQSNNNLLLSDHSTIDSKPQLEIYADDVKCSHGCTIGQLDEDAMFYMRSRGIPQKEAKAVLTFAFASEALENITISQVKERASKLIASKLNVDLDFNL